MSNDRYAPSRNLTTVDPSVLEPTKDPVVRDEVHDGVVVANHQNMRDATIGDCRIIAPMRTRGAQSRLYMAEAGTNHAVVKVYHQHFTPVPGVREAQRNGEDHHIVPLVGEGTYRGCPYEVYPYYKCRTLTQLVEGGLSSEAFVRSVLIPQMGDAISYLQRRGIIHGDISPDNVLVLKGDKSIRLADFGVSVPIPPRGTLLDRRGTPGFVPRLATRGGRVEIASGYDYASLGLLIAYALTGASPTAHMGLSEAEATLRYGRMPSAMPDDLSSLCVALTSPLGGQQNGDEFLRPYMGAVAERRQDRSAEVECRFGEKEIGTIEIGTRSGNMVYADDPASLVDALETNWSLAREIIDAPRLRLFLKGFQGGDFIVDEYIQGVRHLDRDDRVFILNAALRRLVLGPGAAPVAYLGKKHDSIINMLCYIKDNPSSFTAKFLRGDALVRYCAIAGLGEDVANEARRILASSDDVRHVATSALDVFGGAGEDLVLSGTPINSELELFDWLKQADLQQIIREMRGQKLRRWLYSHNMDDVYKEVDSIS